MLLKKPDTESDLETKLAAVANAMRKDYADLQASRNAIGYEIRALAEAPPSRADLERFLVGFIELILTVEHPTGLAFKLREKLERFVKNPGDAEEIKRAWLDSLRSGFDDFEWFFTPLLASTMIANAGTVAKTLPWPDADLDEPERRKRIAALEEKSAGILDGIDAIRDRAARLNIKLD